MKLFQYQALADPISNVYPERVSVDKTDSRIERPDSNWAKSKTLAVASAVLAAATALAYVQPVPAAERTTPDKWHPEIQRPRWDVSRTQFGYPFLSTPDRQQVPDADSWIPEVKQFQFDVKRNQYLYQNYAAPVAPVIPPSGCAVGTADYVLGYKRVRIGKKLIAPVLVPATVQLPDKWHPEIQRPRFDLTRGQYAYQVSSTPDRQQIPDMDSWWQDVKQPQFDLKRQQATYQFWHVGPVSNVYSERTTPDKWGPLPNQPLFDLKRQQYAYPLFSIPERQQIPDADSWFPLANQPVFDYRRQQYTYPFFSTADRQQVPDLDSWFQDVKQPLFDTKRNQFTYAVFVTPDRQQLPRLDSWMPEIKQYQFDLRRQQYTSQFYHAGPISNFFPEKVSVDRWQPTTWERFGGARANLLDAPFVPFIKPTATVDGWGFYPELITRRPQYPTSQTFTAPDRQPQPRLDSWLPKQNRPLFDLKRWQTLYPSLIFSQFFFAERTTPDKWHPEIQRPCFDLRRIQWIFPWLFYDPFPFPSPIFADRWIPETQRPRFDLKRTQFSYPVMPFGPVSAIFTERSTVDKWYQGAELPFSRTSGTFAALQAVSAFPIPVSGTITEDRINLGMRIGVDQATTFMGGFG